MSRPRSLVTRALSSLSSPGGASRVASRGARGVRAGGSGLAGGPFMEPGRKGGRISVRLGTSVFSFPPFPSPPPHPPPKRPLLACRRRRRSATAAASRASASFPSGSALPVVVQRWGCVCVGGGTWVILLTVPGGWLGFARPPSLSAFPPTAALWLFFLRCRRSRPRVGRCRGGGASFPPRFLASRVRPAPVRVPSCRVPARRFKDPGGVAFPPPGSGGRRGP